MNQISSLSGWEEALIAFAVILLILALVNYLIARSAEHRHPPEGLFIEVNGVRLHYSDRGEGNPILLVHGNTVTGDDYNTSGVAERLLATNRVIMFDRPGFGYSSRPRSRVWTAAAQADLLHSALLQLGIRRPLIVGHSWGTLVALAFAIRHRSDTAGLVLLSGYYFPTLRFDALLVAVGAVPVLGDIWCYTISPVFGWLTMPLVKRLMFAPAPVTPRFKAEYSNAMALRPWQIRATAADGALMVPSVAGIRSEYSKLSLPVMIMAGDGDLVVRPRQSQRLHGTIPGSALQIVEGVGHMIHHVATQQVMVAITDMAQRSLEPPPADRLAPAPASDRDQARAEPAQVGRRG